MQKTETRSYAKKHNSHTAFNLQDDFDSIREALRDTTEDVKGRINEILTESLDNVKERSTDLKKGLVQYTTHKPLKSLGLALGAGLIIGLILRARR
jgi:ElaB/YqjD/DUF883 family membrane-anchored ribosome-binding protein